MIDGKNEDSTNEAVAVIKGLREYKFCKHKNENGTTTLSCVSTNDSGIMHAKLFTFSETTDPTGVARKQVSWFGSPNLTDTSGPNQFNNQDVYDDFIEAGVTIRTVPHIHDKFFVAYGKYDGVYQARVYTGSQNWTKSALSYNDEIFVKMAPESATVHPLYDGYARHFNDGYYAGTPCTASHSSCY